MEFKEPGAGRVVAVSLLLVLCLIVGVYAAVLLVPVASVIFPNENITSEEALGNALGVILTLSIGLIAAAIELLLSVVTLFVGRPLRRSFRNGYRIYGYITMAVALVGLLVVVSYAASLGYLSITSTLEG